MSETVTIRPVTTKAERRLFVDFAWEAYKDDPAWVPPLKDEVHGLIDPKKNPWFGHGRAALWLAMRGTKVVGRISAQVDDLVQEHMQAGLGQWGMFDALDGEAAALLIATAEEWLRGLFRAFAHRSELQHRKVSTAFTEPRLPEDDLAAVAARHPALLFALAVAALCLVLVRHECALLSAWCRDLVATLLLPRLFDRLRT